MGNDSNDDPTFTLTLEDATAEQLAMIESGLAHQTRFALAHGADDMAQMASDTAMQLLMENPEFGRRMLFEGKKTGGFIIGDVSDEVKDALDIEVVDGEIMDARNLTQIDIDGE